MSDNSSGWKFQWQKGTRKKEEDAQIYGEEITCLMDKNGGNLTKYQIVEAAQKESSPLHDYFEWDNQKAAEKYRLDQAIYLMRHIEVIFSETLSEPIKAFVNLEVEGNTERLFIPIKTAMSDEDMRTQILEKLRGEIIKWTNKARKYEEFALIIEQIDHVVAELEPVPA